MPSQSAEATQQTPTLQEQRRKFDRETALQRQKFDRETALRSPPNFCLENGLRGVAQSSLVDWSREPICKCET